jgi:hypothetical protein
MAERWALGQAGYSKLLSDQKHQIQARPIEHASELCTWGCCGRLGRGRFKQRRARASAPSFDGMRRSLKRVRRYVGRGTFLKTMRRRGAVHFLGAESGYAGRGLDYE